MTKKMFKVLTHIDTKSGGFWMRIGSGFENRDQSINILLDAIPKNFEIQLRELDEEDLRKREARSTGSVAPPPLPLPLPLPSMARAGDPVPF